VLVRQLVVDERHLAEDRVVGKARKRPRLQIAGQVGRLRGGGGGALVAPAHALGSEARGSAPIPIFFIVVDIRSIIER
jgi:hypothetical protein